MTIQYRTDDTVSYWRYSIVLTIQYRILQVSYTRYSASLTPPLRMWRQYFQCSLISYKQMDHRRPRDEIQATFVLRDFPGKYCKRRRSTPHQFSGVDGVCQQHIQSGRSPIHGSAVRYMNFFFFIKAKLGHSRQKVDYHMAALSV